MIYFVKDCEYELADYIKKHEIQLDLDLLEPS